MVDRITVIDRKKFAGGKNIAPDSDPGQELGDDILEIQTVVNEMDAVTAAKKKAIHVDGNRTDTYTADGSQERPYKTIAAAILVAVAGDTIVVSYKNASPYAENCVIPAGVSLEGISGNYTYINGNITMGASPCSLKYIVNSGVTNVLTINGGTTMRDFSSYGQMSLPLATSKAQMWNCHINATGKPAVLLGNADAEFFGVMGKLSNTGDFRVINSTAGKIMLDQYEVSAPGAATAAAIFSTAGSLGLFNSTVSAVGGGAAINANNGALITAPNVLHGVLTAGDITLGASVTMIENTRSSGTITGTARVYATPLGNYAAAADPVVGDDTEDGYSVGSIWVNTTANPPRAFQCRGAAAGAAVWRQMNAMSNLVAVVPPNPAVDDITLGYDIGSVWVDVAADLIYICVDNTNGAAVWRLSLNVVAAGGELAGNYPNPTVADNVLDAANALAGAVAGLVVDKGVPSSCVIAFDNAGGAAQRPADGASYTFSIGGVPLAAIEARDVVVDQYDFLRSSVGAEEADTILMAAAFAAAINANTVIGLRIRAEIYGGAGDGRWYVQCYTRLQADITAGSALTCVLAGGQPGVYQARATAIAASKSQLFPFEYAVTAQDVLAGEIRFSFGCTAVKAYFIDILTAVGNYTRIAWTGAPSVAGGVLTIDNAGGGTDWSAGNIIRGWLVGTVA